jgi:diguanylate cyclase (GGDEF)-like protein
MPILSYSSTTDTDVVEWSAELGFSCHLSTPLSVVAITYQAAMASPVDLAARLRRDEPTLRCHLSRVEIARELYRMVNVSLEPLDIADALVAYAAAWLPVASWAVIGTNVKGEPLLLAASGLAARTEMATRAMGAWVVAHAQEYGSASLRDDEVTRDAPHVAALALPLICRGRVIGALVGVDREPAVEVPRVSAATLEALQVLLEPAAVALDNAFRIQRAEALAVTDDLTKLYNVRYLMQALRRELKRHVRSRRPLSLLFIDLDGVKGVNDKNGHLCGSRALVEMSRLLLDCSRETDVVARYGGDEFVVVLPETGSDGAMAVAARVCQRVRDHAFLQQEGIDYRLTVSIGVATLPDMASTVEALIQAADEAMYQVKANGEDGIQLAQAALREGVSA